MPPGRDSFLEENKFLLSMLLIVFLLAVISYLLSQWNELQVHQRELALIAELKTSQASAEELATRLQIELEVLDRKEFWAGALHHLSLAFLISFITILAVEFHTRRLMRRDLQEHMDAVKQNVWEALGKRLLGPMIATEIEAIMKEDAAKEDCAYVLTFEQPPEGLPADRVVVMIENSFRLRNLTGVSGRTHRLRASISNYERFGNAPNEVFPRFVRFSVNGQPQDIREALDPANPAFLRKVIPLPEAANERIDVVIAMKIVYKARDSESFITEIPLEGLRVMVINQVPNTVGFISLDMIHRSENAAHPTEGTWEFDKAVLPGQGFALNWREHA